MKITFRGWRRMVFLHEVDVEPVEQRDGLYQSIDGKKSLIWSGSTRALGKVKDLALSGSFLAEFEFTPAELRSWLARYLAEKPEEAISLIAEAQNEALRERDRLKWMLKLVADAIRSHQESLESHYLEAEARSTAEKAFKRLRDQLSSSLKRIDREWSRRW